MRYVKSKLDRKWFTRSLKRCWKTFLNQSGNCRKSPSTEAVHQLRVASRRLLAQLQILNGTVPQVKSGKAERFLKRLRKELGELRDTQVQRDLLAGWSKSFPGVHAIREHLGLREARLLKLAGREVKDLKFKKLRKYMARIKAELRAESKHPARRDLATHVLSCADRAFAQSVRKLEAIDHTRPETIHSTRIAFKKFRYTVETLPDTITGLAKKDKQKLSAYQDRMGRIQDLEVLDRVIAAFEKTHPEESKSIVRFRRHLGAQRAKALVAFQCSAGDLLTFWPPDP